MTVSSEIMKTINFYTATKPRETVGKVYLTGGSSLLPGLKERVAQDTGAEVLFLDPLLLLPEKERGDYQQNESVFMPVALYLSSRIGDVS